MPIMKMMLWRDDYTGPACLEYSWVPEGVRHSLQLRPGQQEGEAMEPIGDGANPSHVQVYVANINERASVEMWTFPPAPPAPSPVATALVEIFYRRSLIVGTVYYEDGTMASAWKKLDWRSRPCPQG